MRIGALGVCLCLGCDLSTPDPFFKQNNLSLPAVPRLLKGAPTKPLVVCATRSGDLYASSDGESMKWTPKWDHVFKSSSRITSLAVSDQGVITVASEGKLACLKHGGGLQWNIEVPTRDIYSTFLADSGVALVSGISDDSIGDFGEAGRIVAISLETGQILRVQDTVGVIVGFAKCASTGRIACARYVHSGVSGANECVTWIDPESLLLHGLAGIGDPPEYSLDQRGVLPVIAAGNTGPQLFIGLPSTVLMYDDVERRVVKKWDYSARDSIMSMHCIGNGQYCVCLSNSSITAIDTVGDRTYRMVLPNEASASTWVRLQNEDCAMVIRKGGQSGSLLGMRLDGAK